MENLHIKEIDLAKIEFEQIIEVLEKLNVIDSLDLEKYHLSLMNILTSIIKKYHYKNDWFFKRLLYFFFDDSINMFYILRNKDYFKNYCPMELFNILDIIRTYKLSEIIDLFFEKNKIYPIKANNVDEWFKKNINLALFCLNGLSILAPLVTKDLNIPKNFDFSNSIIEQFLCIILYHFYPVYKLTTTLTYTCRL